MATPEQLKLSRKKALESPLIGKRGKGKKTLEKEERRRIFEEIVTEDFPNIIAAARPEYKLDQYLGKAPDKVEHTIVDKPAQEIVELANELTKIQRRATDSGE